MAPTSAISADMEDAASAEGASERIREEQQQISRVQEWWSEGAGPAAVARSPILSTLDEALLSELIEAGGGYHTILTADRLDGMHRRWGSGAEPALEPLRKALQTRGGAKSQARVVGMLLFKEARSLYEQAKGLGGSLGGSASGPAAAAAAPGAATAGGGAAAAAQPGAPVAGPEAGAGAADEAPVRLDERWSPPRRYVCSDTYPEGAQMAVRAAPSQKGEILATVPAGSEYMATGRVAEYLQVCVTQNGAARNAYVLHSLGDRVLLVPAPTPSTPRGQPAGAAAATVAGAAAPQPGGLDETWSPPRRYICAETYPAGAQMMARAAPSPDGQEVAMLPPGTEYFATGRVGEYLEVSLEVDGARTKAYVLRSLGDLTLLVPEASAKESSGAPAAAAAAAAVEAAEAARVAAAAATAATDTRVELLEARVTQQDRQIQVLQTELAALKAQLGAVATAFKPIAMAGA